MQRIQCVSVCVCDVRAVHAGQDGCFLPSKVHIVIAQKGKSALDVAVQYKHAATVAVLRGGRTARDARRRQV